MDVLHEFRCAGECRYWHARVLSHLAFRRCLITDILDDLCYGYKLEPSIQCQVGSPGLSLASGFEHPASTLPTRFPAALGIGHDRPAA